MIKPIAIATIILTAATSALAQGGNPPPAGQPAVIGQTGTMYDGNNANLQLQPEQNPFWAQLWAQPGAQGNPAAVSAVGAGAVGTGAAGASLGTTKTGGEH